MKRMGINHSIEIAFIIISVFIITLSILVLGMQSAKNTTEITNNINTLKTRILELAVSDLDAEKARAVEQDIHSFFSDKTLRTFLNAYSIETQNYINKDTGKELSPLQKLLQVEKSIAIISIDQQMVSRSLRVFLFIIESSFVLFALLSNLSRKKKIVQMEQQKKLDNTMLTVLEDERIAIAFDLHDSVLQKIAFVKQQINSRHHLKEDDAIQKILDDTVLELRTLYLNLYNQKIPSTLSEHIETLFADFNALGTIKLDTSQFGLDSLVISEKNQNNLYRILQELLSNGYKHSLASNIKLHIYGLPTLVRIVYTDNGKGIADSDIHKMQSIRYRCNLLQAKIQSHAVNEDNSGCCIHIEISTANLH